MALLDKLFTVKEVAEQLHLAEGYVRQICVAQGIGTKIGSMRFLSNEDIEAINEHRRSIGIRQSYRATK